MASKRQKKKQQKKQQSKQLHQYELSERQIREIIRQHRYEAELHAQEQRRELLKQEAIQRTKQAKKDARNEVLRSRREALRAAGYSNKEISKLQFRSQKSIDELVRLRQDWYLVVGYKDITEETDSEALYTMKEMNKRQSRKTLINSILGWLEAGENQGYIGGYKMMVTDDVNSAHALLAGQGYLNAYTGQGKYLNPLLTLIDNMMFLVYTMDQKDAFIAELVENLRYLPYPEAHKNADIIEKEFLSETAEHF
jgi:hypothetical protein